MWSIVVLLEASLQLRVGFIFAQIQILQSNLLSQFPKVRSHPFGVNLVECNRLLGHVLQDVLAFLRGYNQLLFFANSFGSDLGWPHASLRTLALRPACHFAAFC